MDNIFVRAPRTVGFNLDSEPYTFIYTGGCINATDEQHIISKVTCPTNPNTEAVMMQFTDGCVGNPSGSHAMTEPLMGLVGFVSISIYLIYLIKITGLLDWFSGNFDENKSLPYLVVWILTLILVGMTWSMYLAYNSYEPIQQCPPIDRRYQSNNMYDVGFMGGENLSYFAKGCIWSITDEVDFLWANKYVSTTCPWATMDTSDPKAAVVTVHARPSSLVIQAITHTLNQLFICALVGSGLGGVIGLAILAQLICVWCRCVSLNIST